MTTNKDCLIYMRTSSMTNSKGDSVKRQKSSIMKWVKSNGYTVRGSYWDIESGKNGYYGKNRIYENDLRFRNYGNQSSCLFRSVSIVERYNCSRVYFQTSFFKRIFIGEFRKPWKFPVRFSHKLTYPTNYGFVLRIWPFFNRSQVEGIKNS